METFTDDTVVALASFLAPHDMLSLALTCKRFGDEYGTTTSLAAREANKSRGSGREVRQKTDSISLMEVAARTILHVKWTEEEKNALPRREDESWIGIYQEFLKLFHYPLQFDKLVGRSIEYVDEGSNKTTVVCMSGIEGQGGFHSAICSNIMRAGRHSVSFNINNPTGGAGIVIGIMRPTREDIKSLAKCYPAFDNLSSFSLKDYKTLHRNNVDCCSLSTIDGSVFICKRWTDNEPSHQTEINDWEGREAIRDTSFKIGFVLDLDEGTLDVYKNDRRLGSMVAGLAGEYCWVVSLQGTSKTVSIDR